MCYKLYKQLKCSDQETGRPLIACMSMKTWGRFLMIEGAGRNFNSEERRHVMVTIELTEEEAAESREMLKAVIKPLERSIAATKLAERDYRQFLKNRRNLVDELIKRLEK